MTDTTRRICILLTLLSSRTLLDNPCAWGAAGADAKLAALCAKGDQVCTKYLPVWKATVLKLSGVNNAYFNKHVVPLQVHSEKWQDGESVRVSYRLKIEWATMEMADTFIVNVGPDAPPWPAAKLPRGVYLGIEEIARAAEHHAMATDILQIERIEHLKYKSEDEALAVLRAMPNGAGLRTREIKFHRRGVKPMANGHPFLHATGVFDDLRNQCLGGSIDLVTGEAHVNFIICRHDVPIAVPYQDSK
jgi:hypothetical protein